MKNVLLNVAIAASVLCVSMSASWAADAVAAAAAKEAGAVVTASGLVYRSLKDGTGASPKASDKVKVHYRGTFPDGKEFDSSYKRNEAIEFPLNGVIPCPAGRGWHASRPGSLCQTRQRTVGVSVIARP